jgi:glycosyltransferase involved in cell wall biosynthesis
VSLTPERPGLSPAPRVSIGVPVYNGERFLAETLESLVNQSYRDLEIIIGDNCSTDGTEAICRSLAARDPRVRYLRHERNLGIAGNYMRLLEEARGGYFRWAAADDLSDPRAVEACVEALDQHPDAVLAYPKTRLIDEEGKQLEDYEDNVDLPFARPSERFTQLLIRLGLCNAVFGLIRTEVLRRTRGIRPFVGSDIPFLAELALHGKFVEVPERLFSRRFHPAASSALQGNPLQHLFTPGRNKVGTPNWDRLKALVLSVARTPIPLGEKCRAGLYILQIARAQRTFLARELSAGLVRLTHPASWRSAS